MAEAPRPVKRSVAVGKVYQSLFGTPDGRLVLVDLMKEAGMLEVGSLDPYEGPYQTGRRSMVLHIMAKLRMDYERLLELSQERPVDEIALSE